MLPCAHSSEQRFLKSHSCASYKCLLRTLPRADYLRKRVGRFYEFDTSVGRTSSYVAPLCHIFRAAGSSRLARNQSLYNRRHPCLVNKGCCGSFRPIIRPGGCCLLILGAVVSPRISLRRVPKNSDGSDPGGRRKPSASVGALLQRRAPGLVAIPCPWPPSPWP